MLDSNGMTMHKGFTDDDHKMMHAHSGEHLEDRMHVVTSFQGAEQSVAGILKRKQICVGISLY